MTEFHIGAEVGLVDDHDRRGVIVDSHPVNGWLVWWCWEMSARWETDGLWLRPDERMDETLRQRDIATRRAIASEARLASYRESIASALEHVSPHSDAAHILATADEAAEAAAVLAGGGR